MTILAILNNKVLTHKERAAWALWEITHDLFPLYGLHPLTLKEIRQLQEAHA